MAASIGTFSQLGISASNPVDARLDFQSGTIGLDEEFKDTNGIRGTRENDVTRVRSSIRRVMGNLRLQPNAAEWALLLEWILGGTPSGTSYPLGESIPARYVTVDKIAKVPTYDGVKVSRAVIRASQGMPLEVDLDLIGIDETLGDAASFPSLTINTASGGPFMFHDLVLTIAGTEYKARDFEIVIDNKIDRDRFFNSQTITAVNALEREISFRTSLPYGDAVAAYGTGAGGVAVVGTFTNGTLSLAFSMVKVCFPRKSPHVEGRTEIMLPLQGIAYKSSSTLSLVTTLDSTV